MVEEIEKLSELEKEWSAESLIVSYKKSSVTIQIYKVEVAQW